MIATRTTSPHRLPCAIAIALLAGCGGEDAPGGGGAGAADSTDSGASGAGASADAGGTGSPTSELVGSFLVKLVAQKDDTPAHASFLGKLFDAPPLPLVPLVLDSEVGDCRLLVPEVPFCDPPCMASACTADDVCTPFPTPQSAGTVLVHGLGDEPLELEPVGSSFTYMPASLPYPPCDAGEPIRVEADAFELESACIAPIVLPDDEIVVRSGQSAMISWTAGEVATARVRIVLDIAHHGGQKGEISCDVPDTGTFQIPEELVTKLVSLGVAGFPTVVVSRVTSDAAENLPAVTLTVSAEVERVVDTGNVSCLTDDDCPDRMSCDPMTLICRQ